MRIAVLSGKGGTGKTLVSVNLAAVAPGSPLYVDCDVEEPNGHLFLKPQGIKTEDIAVKIPVVNQDLCNGCKKCIDFCNFNALAYIKEKLIVFKDICHSCGGCVLVCPEKALSEVDKNIGVINRGISDNIRVLTGILDTGQASGVPIIDSLMDYIPQDKNIAIIDCPPGTACVVMESIKDADYCVLVAEPTIFGVHNLNMVFELVKLFNKPFGVVLNKCFEDENPAEKFCIDNGIKVLCKIPFDTELGLINSKAIIAVRENEKYKAIFKELLDTLIGEVHHETTINP